MLMLYRTPKSKLIHFKIKHLLEIKKFNKPEIWFLKDKNKINPLTQ